MHRLVLVPLPLTLALCATLVVELAPTKEAMLAVVLSPPRCELELGRWGVHILLVRLPHVGQRLGPAFALPRARDRICER